MLRRFQIYYFFPSDNPFNSVILRLLKIKNILEQDKSP